MVDKVRPLKFENPTDGTQFNRKQTETDPNEDYLASKGIAFENNNNLLLDVDANGYVRVKDNNFTTPITIKEIYDLLIAHASRHLPNGADPLATGVATTLNADTVNAEGDANSFARANHTHDITTGTAVTIGANSSNQEGNSPSLARSNHTHDINTGVVSQQLPDQTNAEGASDNLARADHIHNIPTSVPVDTGTSNSQGTANSFSRSDHVHKTTVSTALAKSAVEVSTNSNTNIDLNGLELTPIAGTYILVCSVILSSNDRNSDNFIGIYVDDVLISDTEEAMENNQQNSTNNTYMTFIAMAKDVVLNGSNVVNVQVRTTSGTTTYYLRNLLAIKVG